MTPRKLIEWAIAFVVVALSMIIVIALATDFYYRDFARFGLMTEIRGFLPIMFVAVAATVPTMLVFLLRAPSGSLDFKWMGIQFSGPAGPVLLWAVTFALMTAALLALIRVSK